MSSPTAPRITKLSRRQFIKQAGAFGVSVGLLPPGRNVDLQRGAVAILGTSLGVPDTKTSREIVGRALNRVDIWPTPSRNTPPIGRYFLAPDSVYPIHGVAGEGWWYEVNSGYVPRDTLQPMLAYKPPVPQQKVGYHEVIAPVTVVRDHCSGLANMVARLSFGALLYVHDHLTDDGGQVWCAVSASVNGAGWFGWTHAAHLRLSGIAPKLSHPAVWVDSAGQKLAVYDGEQLVGETAIYTGEMLAGAGKLVTVAPTASIATMPYVRPYVMAITGMTKRPMPVYGAFWHNRFGLSGAVYPQVELPTFAARWLFGMVSLHKSGIDVVVEQG
jgi:hypothetical protein